MKKLFAKTLFVVLSLMFLGCSYEEVAKELEVVPEIEIALEQWNAVIESQGGVENGNVKLRVYGTTNCDVVTVVLYENGNPYETRVTLTNGKVDFNEVVNSIKNAKVGDSITQTTVIRGYLGDVVKEITLNSGELKFK